MAPRRKQKSAKKKTPVIVAVAVIPAKPESNLKVLMRKVQAGMKRLAG